MVARGTLQQEAAPNWRISLDRAWRSAPVRQLFETECGLAPLSIREDEAAWQAFSGHTEQYHERFLLWATKHFGLEAQAPAAIRKKISSET